MSQPTTLIGLLLILACRAPAQQVPQYDAPRTIDKISIDGRLDELTWGVSPRVGSFRHIGGVSPQGLPATEAAVVWDEARLYIAFACEDPDPWSTMMRKDMHLWEQEVVEVFLDPDADGRDYPELEVSPNNVIVDLLIPAKPNAKTNADIAAKWDIAGLQTAVHRTSGGWSVEIAIPWKSLKPAGVTGAPKIGDQWRVGLYRIERELHADAAPDAETYRKRSRFLAWSPTERSFHEPEKFGIVRFVERIP